MIKATFYYILSNALSRGSFILYSPLLLSILTLEEFGLYNLIFISAMMLSPILSIGGGAVILREGVNNRVLSDILFIKYILRTSFLSIIIMVVLFIFDTSQYKWLSYSVLYGSMEAMFLLILSYYRTLDNFKGYLYIAISRFCLVLFVYLLAIYFHYSFEKILLLQFIMMLTIVSLLILMIILKTNRISNIQFDDYSLFLFGLFLIPHGLSQWVMSSSDRVLIKFFLDNSSLGLYSIGYIFASLLLLLNSGIGLALPQMMIKDYDKWLDEKLDLYWLKFYSLSSIILLVIIEIFFTIDKTYFHLLKYYTSEMYLVFSFIYMGVLALGFYYFYANYLFYHKKSKTISLQTLLAASINIILTIVLLQFFNIVGAAMATMISYFIYVYLVKQAALNLEKKLLPISKRIDQMYLFTIVIVSLILIIGWKMQEWISI